jgi:type II secretory pathway component PulF
MRTDRDIVELMRLLEPWHLIILGVIGLTILAAVVGGVVLLVTLLRRR